MDFINIAFADSPIIGNDVNPKDLFITIVAIIILISGILSIIFILRGGLLMILSGGKEEKTTPALNTIRYAIFGLIITVAMLYIFPLFLKLLGFDQYFVGESFPGLVFDKIRELGNIIFQGGGYSGETYLDPNELPADFSDL